MSLAHDLYKKVKWVHARKDTRRGLMPSNRIKLIAMDIDGTLVDVGSRVSEENARAIARRGCARHRGCAGDRAAIRFRALRYRPGSLRPFHD